VRNEFLGSGIDRRSFLKQSGGALLTLGLIHLVPTLPRESRAARSAAAAPAPGEGSYQSYQDIYRESWTWDKVVHSSHARANCISGCSWQIFVKDGIAWREEQNAIYRSSEPGVVPDFNPRGCQKGASYTSLMYEASRIVHPLRRVGERGSGKWKRVSWEEALTELADKMIDASVSQGTGSIVYDHGTTNIDFGADTASEMRFFGILNATVLDSWAGVGDMPAGAAQTWGMYNVEGTSDDWFKSDFIIVWVGNPTVSRMPEVHFMHEARYRGAKLVVVAPDYSPTAVHADYWLNPRIGADAALALAMAQVILGENLHDEEYIREQTDLPILVRDDTSRYLRGSDVENGGKEDLLYFWDGVRDRMAEVPGCQGEGSKSLALGALSPALSGRYSVELADGSTVKVRPLLGHLREHLDANYTPEMAAGVTGVGEGTIRKLARELAAAKTAMIYSSWGACKHYHSDLPQRAEILLMALTGNQGKSGGGLRVAAWWPVDGFHELSNPDMGSSIPWMTRLRLLWRMLAPASLGGGMGWREFEDLMVETKPYRGWTPLMPWLYSHAGYAEIWDKREFHDPAVPRSTSEYMKEAVDKGWVPIRPLPGSEPRVFVFTGANPLRRWPAPQYAEKYLWPKLEMIVDVNFKASTSGMKGDLILPTSGYYERDSLKYSQTYLPYLLLCEKAVEPLGEAKPEWEIFGLLARKVQERAVARGVSKVRDAVNGEVDISKLYEAWSNSGEFHESDPKRAIEWILDHTPSTGNMSLAEAEKTGLLPVIKATGGPDPLYSTATDYRTDRTLYPHARFVEGKEAWPTYSGRQQFLLDHPWYEEAGEALPVHKDPPMAGGDYALRLSGGHTRWSIHATWRDTELMLRLQRGEPAVWVAERDAKQRGITDGDRIRVYNDVGEFEAIAKVATSVQPGEVIAYHAWEPYQFKSWKGCQEPVPAPWKALHLAGGYGQLHYRSIYLVPGHSPRAQAVEIAKAT
jgi:DMSO reductase family type II enzyme molybdopterin subunit